MLNFLLIRSKVQEDSNNYDFNTSSLSRLFEILEVCILTFSDKNRAHKIGIKRFDKAINRMERTH